MQDTNTRIPIIIIAITIIGCILFTISMIFSWDTWVDKKSIYKELIVLTGKISANTGNIEELKVLKPEFDKFYGGEMVYAEANDPELLKRMMILQKDYENHILGRNDFYRADKLNQSCQKLIKQLSVSISSGDRINRFRIFVPLIIGILVLILYFSFRALLAGRSKKQAYKSKESLSQNLIEELKTLIGNAKTVDALNKLEFILAEMKSPKLDELLMIKAQFNNNQRDKNLDLIDTNQERLGSSKINKAILDLINELE